MGICSHISILKSIRTKSKYRSKRNGDTQPQRRHMANSATATQLLVTSVPFFFFLLVTAVSATDHIVGANRGWNPGINYTLWANNQTFLVGDFISFRYQKTQYNVFEVNQTGYDNCTTEGAMGNWSSGKDFILLNDSKKYYFICGNGGCFSGMKVSILVHPLPHPPPSSKNSTTDSAATPPLVRRSVVVGIIVAVLTSIWV